MSTLNTPLQLSTAFKPKIWGREDLSPIYSAPGETDSPASRKAEISGGVGKPGELIGEVWATDDTSRFLNGPVAGLTLDEVSEKYGPELHGSAWKGRRFPLLAKYIFTSDWLSVQVHPDDEYARVHDPGNVGKCEMWYILQADAGAEILLAVKPGVTKEALKAAFQKGTSKELLERHYPKAGEAIFVPPGTVHALGPGLVLFEVEQNSDLTYRLDDFGRAGLDGKPRPLHLAKGMDVIREDLPPRHQLSRLEFQEPFGTRRYIMACPYFAVEEIFLRKMATFKSSPERVEVYSVLKGTGRVENTAGWLGYRTGETWIIPPAAGAYRFVAQQGTCLLKFYVPNLAADFRRPLAGRKVPPELVEQVVFEL
jgi:mannose-6-phosphate isomerase